MIPFNKPSLEGSEIDNILAAVASGKLAGNGRFTKQCQHLIQATTGALKTLLTASGTGALEMSALLCDIQSGDEVIMPSYTFVSTANAFCLRGAVPVFVDIRPGDLNIDPVCVARAVTAKTRAIVVVHYAGVSCDMEAVCRVADRHGLFVIEDAAHAYLSRYRNRYAGTLGDFGIFSFHETKNLICGEGGALVINNPDYISRAEIIWEKGTDRARFFRGETDKYTWVDLGSSFLPNELTAAFLFGQLRQQEAISEKRQQIYQRYVEGLRPLAEKKKVCLPDIPAGCTSNYHMFYLITADHDTRTRLLTFLRQENIAAVFHYVPLHTAPYARKIGIKASLPVTENLSARIVRLPFFNDITPDEQAYIIQAVYRFYRDLP